jgi:hypothetical protein
MHFSNFRRQTSCLHSGYFRSFLSITRKISDYNMDYTPIAYFPVLSHSPTTSRYVMWGITGVVKGTVIDCKRTPAAALPRVSMSCYWNWWLDVMHKHGDLQCTIYMCVRPYAIISRSKFVCLLVLVRTSSVFVDSLDVSSTLADSSITSCHFLSNLFLSHRLYCWYALPTDWVTQ